MFYALIAALAVATSTPPITVQSCSYATAAGGTYSHGVNIAFVNDAKVAATKITFAVVHGSTRYDVTDEGTFAPGVRIEHVLHSSQLQFWHGSDPHHCIPIIVRFADGSVWTTPPQ